MVEIEVEIYTASLASKLVSARKHFANIKLCKVRADRPHTFYRNTN